MYITGNLINAYFICYRKVWLFSHQLTPDHQNDLLELGKIISENAYARMKKEINIGENMKIDLLKTENGNIIIGEIKKSSVSLISAEMQLSFYLYQLKQNGIDLEGELLIPKERKKFRIKLTTEIENKLLEVIKNINQIISLDKPPKIKRTKYCKHCAYNEFCWS